LPAPIDAFHVMRDVLVSRRVSEAVMDKATGNLRFRCEGDVVLKVFNFTGFEIWKLIFPDGTALTYRNEHFEAQSVCPGGLDRPWTRRQDVACNPGAAVPSVATVSSDATLLQQDVDAERLHSSARGARG